MIAITFALPAESSEFLKRVSNKSQSARNGIVAIRGTVDGRPVEVLHTGVGEKICRERIGKFLEDAQFDILISAGFAGALSDRLQINDLLFAQNFSTVDLKHAQSSVSNVSVHSVNMLTVPALIDSSEERERLSSESGASAVDMETEFIARACAAHGIPLLALRVITDTPTQPFPASPSVLFDVEQQRTHMTALSKFFLVNPKRLASLIRFASRIGCARTTLANMLVQIVRNLYPKASTTP